MNAARRKRVTAVVEQLRTIEQELINLADEEQNAFDNLPESIQAGARGQKMEEAIDSLQESQNGVEEAAQGLADLCNT